MIRGVDRETREAIKDADRAEGTNVGTWVRRALLRSLEAKAQGRATSRDANERLRVLEMRLSVLEKSDRHLHHKTHAPGRLIDKSESENPKKWRRTEKSK